MCISQGRSLDNLAKDYGEEHPLTAVKPDAETTQSKHFESGTCKVQGVLETTLTGTEAQAVKTFLEPQQPAMTSHETPQRGCAVLVDAAEKKSFCL